MYCLRTRHIPLRPYGALTIGPIVLLRRGVKLSPTLLRHEMIHWRQSRELLVIGFYLWYILEWLFRLMQETCNNDSTLKPENPFRRAYARICFEREAYAHQNNPQYLAERPAWAFLKYLR